MTCIANIVSYIRLYYIIITSYFLLFDFFMCSFFYRSIVNCFLKFCYSIYHMLQLCVCLFLSCFIVGCMVSQLFLIERCYSWKILTSYKKLCHKNKYQIQDFCPKFFNWVITKTLFQISKIMNKFMHVLLKYDSSINQHTTKPWQR